MARRWWTVKLVCGHSFRMFTETGRQPASRFYGCECSLPLVEIVSVAADRGKVTETPDAEEGDGAVSS